MASRHLVSVSVAIVIRGQSNVHLSSMLSRHTWHVRVRDEPPIEKLHDIEACADHIGIFAENVNFRYRDVGVFEGMENAELALDLMGRL